MMMTTKMKIARANTRNAIAESAQSLTQDIIDGQVDIRGSGEIEREGRVLSKGIGKRRREDGLPIRK